MLNNTECIARIDSIADRFEAEKTHYAKEWVKNLNQHLSGSRRLILWGAGLFGNDVYMRFLQLAGVNISAVCDSSPEKQGKMFGGTIPIISPEEVKPHYCVIIAVSGHEEEIETRCLELGVPKENIFFAPINMLTWSANYLCSTDDFFCKEMICNAKKILPYFGSDRRSKELLLDMMYRRLLDASKPYEQDGTQYFIPELPLRPDEAFVDAGAYTGDTLADFIQHLPADVSVEKVCYYAFECGAKNCEAFRENLKNMDCGFPVELYPVALWDGEEFLNFFDDNGASSMVDSLGARKVLAQPLDKVLDGKRVSWIKMDIEGAEMKALQGCASIIREQKPRLSICVYHKAADIYEITRYIKSLRSDYQMLLRHHSPLDFETVLYAY